MLWLFRLFGLNYQQWYGHRGDPTPGSIGFLNWGIDGLLWGIGNILQWGADPYALYWGLDDLEWGTSNTLQWTGITTDKLLTESSSRLIQEDGSSILLEV